jgi:hypothetical protein
MLEDKAMSANLRMFAKAASKAEAKAMEYIDKGLDDAAIRWLTLAKECRWAATGEDSSFSLPTKSEG